MSQKPEFKMDNEMRDLMHQVMDGDSRIVPILHRMQPLTRLKDILQWLVLNGITGENFVQWYYELHGESIVSIASWALKYIRRDLTPQPIIYGKDWLK